ncbi:MAG: CDP-glucose 4,6-dehydratase [Candidatus Omnitrophica bacterium]|nr:CDP-glucose 4,6-dehydratase [Candidatus Omnitrophota bacterium]
MSSFLQNAYKDKTVLVTGHTGFKGSWLLLWLAELGAKVIGYSLEPHTEPSIFNAINLREKVTHIIGDVNDHGALCSLFKKYQPEFVFHLAAQSLVRRSYEEPMLTYQTNVMGTLNVLEAIRKIGSVKACVIVTSDKCYENREISYCYKETDPLGGYDLYSSSKGCAELLTSAYRRSFFNPEDYNKTHSLALSSARAGNIIGGGDWADNRIIPDCVRALSKGESIVVRNPEATRPWHYVLECLSGYLLLGALMRKDGVKYSDAWNFGPKEENEMSVEELVKLTIKYWGNGKYARDTAPHPHEAGLLKLDISKACGLLHWDPIYKVSEAMERTVKWYRLFYSNASVEDLRKFTINEIRGYQSSMKRGWN